MGIEIVTLNGSGLAFINSYSANVTAAYQAAIVAAENFFQSHFTNKVTLDVTFDLKPINDSFTAQNSFPSAVANVSFSSLVSALQSHETSADGTAAVTKLLTSTDPTSGAGFLVPIGLARNLGLASAGNSGSVDDSIVLNSDYGWTFGADAVGVLEHELSEGLFGRIGGLGIQNADWGPMDLFRYTAAGVRDYSGGRDGVTTYFSVDGATELLPFHNSESTGGVFDNQDFADWNDSVVNDVFGPSTVSQTGAGGTVTAGSPSATDLSVCPMSC